MQKIILILGLVLLLVDGLALTRNNLSASLPIYPAHQSISLGMDHACAITPTARIVCWGWNTFGQLGASTSERDNSLQRHPISSVPIAVPGVRGAVSLALGRDYSCALLDSGNVVCWGGGSTEIRRIDKADNTVRLAAAGDSNLYCALKASKELVCWQAPGNIKIQRTVSETGYIGFASFGESVPRPKGVTPCIISQGRVAECWGPDGERKEIVASANIFQVGSIGMGHCVVLENGLIHCRTIVGAPTGSPLPPFALINEITDAQSLNCGGSSKCLIVQNTGDLIQLSMHQATDGHLVTKKINGVFDATEAASSSHFSCAKKSSGAIVCWGQNQVGQLGRGRPGPSTDVPALVTGFP